MELPGGRVLKEPGERVDHLIFPESGVVSLVAPQMNGDSPELASIGREGVVGCTAAIGSKSNYGRWLVQVPGRAYRCPVAVFQRVFDTDSEFRQMIVCYLEALLTQTMQSVVCNAMHPVAARCARWILVMRDRSNHDVLPLTQEFLAQMLSVHRSSVVLTNGAFQQAGLLEAARGRIRILDRDGLEGAACECYRLVRNRYNDLLPGTFPA